MICNSGGCAPGLSRMKPQYNRWTVVVLVGLGCAAFSRLFGGDWPVFLVTFVAAAVASGVWS